MKRMKGFNVDGTAGVVWQLQLSLINQSVS